jgi:dTDP-4-amino-4,6-dideoxygalactose transaminase
MGKKGSSMTVTMSWADINADAKRKVKDVLDSGWLSRRKYIPRFEEKIARLHDAKRGIFMNSGTDALRISLMTLKEIHKWRNGDEIIIPGLTFVATANAVLQSGLKPVFADVQRETGNIEPSQIASRITRLTRAVIVVHLFGLPADMRAVMRIARTGSLKVIEDSCETIGVHRVAGDMACFSFYQSHHVQCGVGGMIVTNSPTYESVARSYMNHGRIDDGSHFKFGRIGYSSRATELEAALGLVSLNGLTKNLSVRRALAFQYNERLWNVGKSVFERSSWMFYPLLLQPGLRDKLLAYLRKNRIESREAMPLINQPCYKGLYKKGDCPNVEEWTENGILLPLHPLMKLKDVDYVCDTIQRFMRSL